MAAGVVIVNLTGAAEWPVLPARRLLMRLDRPVASDAETVTAFRDGQVVLRSARRVEGFTESIKDVGYQGVEPGDLVVHSMDAFAGAIGVSESRGKMSPVVHIYRSRSPMDLRFVAYYLRHLAASGYILALAKGIRERSTSFDPATLADVCIPVPPLDVQRQIADFLDGQLALVDQLINARERQAKLVEEALVSELDSLLWRGKEPMPLKHLVRSITSGPRGWGDLVNPDGARPFLRITNLPKVGIAPDMVDVARVTPPDSAEARRAAVAAGDVLMGITASVGEVALVEEGLTGSAFSQHVARIRPTQRSDSEWLAWALQSRRVREELTTSAYGGTKVGLGLAEVANVGVPSTSPEERQSVVVEARSLFSQMSTAKRALENSARLFAELRRSLVTEAVTGAVDVAEGSRVAATS